MRPARAKTSHPEYAVWSGMKSRCLNPRAKAYPYYGGRGITVCQRWADSFDAFLQDMGPRPDGTWLERVANEKGYEPGNCIWSTPLKQAQNRRPHGTAKFDGFPDHRRRLTHSDRLRMETARRKLAARGIAV